MSQTNDAANKIQVLIADDVTETRRSTRLMLSLLSNVEVVAFAENGREAVELTRQHRPDIALMDVNMPEMNGLEAIRQMMEIHPFLGCIVISAERDTQTLLEAMAVGARYYLTKPFTAEQLRTALQKVIRAINRQRRALPAAPAAPAAAQPPADPPAKSPELAQLRQQRDRFLRELAEEYLRTRRTDAKAMEVLELLAQSPQCEVRTLTALAMIYAINHEWRKLRLLAARLEGAGQ